MDEKNRQAIIDYFRQIRPRRTIARIQVQGTFIACEFDNGTRWEVRSADIPIDYSSRDLEVIDLAYSEKISPGDFADAMENLSWKQLNEFKRYWENQYPTLKIDINSKITNETELFQSTVCKFLNISLEEFMAQYGKKKTEAMIEGVGAWKPLKNDEAFESMYTMEPKWEKPIGWTQRAKKEMTEEENIEIVDNQKRKIILD